MDQQISIAAIAAIAAVAIIVEAAFDAAEALNNFRSGFWLQSTAQEPYQHHIMVVQRDRHWICSDTIRDILLTLIITIYDIRTSSCWARGGLGAII